MNYLLAHIAVYLKNCRVHGSIYAYEYKLVLNSANEAIFKTNVSVCMWYFCKTFVSCTTLMYKQLSCLHFCFQQLNSVVLIMFHHVTIQWNCHENIIISITKYLNRIRCASAVCLYFYYFTSIMIRTLLRWTDYRLRPQ